MTIVDRLLFESGERVHTYAIRNKKKIVVFASSELGELLPLGSYERALDGTRRRVLAVRVDPPGRSGAGAILYAHGNGYDLGSLLSTGLLAKLAKAAGRPVVAVEFPGYGPQPASEVSAEDAVRAFVAAYKRLSSSLRGDGGGGVALAGFSMGTGIATEAAARILSLSPSLSPPPAGLFLEGAYTSPLRTGPAWPLRLPLAKTVIAKAVGKDVPFQTLRTLKSDPRIAESGLPVWIVHGEKDSVCPAEGARKLASLPACAASLFLPDRRHTDLPMDRGYLAFLRAFASSTLAVTGRGLRRRRHA